MAVEWATTCLTSLAWNGLIKDELGWTVRMMQIAVFDSNKVAVGLLILLHLELLWCTTEVQVPLLRGRVDHIGWHVGHLA